MSLVSPHGPQSQLLPRLAAESERGDLTAWAATLPRLPMTTRETSDLLMLGMGAFTPLSGFMGRDDWLSVCDRYEMADGVFWPIPITLSASADAASSLRPGDPVALMDEDTQALMAVLTVSEVYTVDKEHEARQVFRTTDAAHPGVAKLLAQRPFNVAGSVQVLSEGPYPVQYPGLYLRPAETRERFQSLGWSTVAALQTRNPMHRSHEYLAKVAIEVVDGLLIHQVLGKLKAGDIPADVRVRAIDTLVEQYFVPGTCIQAGYPMEMRYAGPREALLHALIRQNFGCSHLLVGRDHAGVGDYYGPFDAHRIFEEIPKDALEIQAMKMDWTFYCRKCDGMATGRTCPHGPEDRVVISGTRLRRMLSDGDDVPDHFSRPEVLSILRQYYEAEAADRPADSLP